jgi:cyanate permease
MPVGTALTLFATPPAMAAFGWRAWWVLLGLLVMAMAAVLVVCLPADPARTSARGGALGTRLRTTLGARGPWLVAVTFGVYSAQWLSVIGFLPSVYAQLGVSAALAGAATAVAALVNMIGNVAAGRLLQRAARPQRLLATGFVSMAIGGCVAFGSSDAASRYAGVLLFSMLGGLVPATLFSLAVRVAPGTATISTTVGWMQQWSSFGQFAGPPLVAWVAMLVGGWEWSGAVTGALAAAGLALAALLARQPVR